MKVTIGGRPPIIVGKRVTVGALVGSITAIMAHFVPQHAPAFMAASVPITMIAQIIIANWLGVTTNESE